MSVTSEKIEDLEEDSDRTIEEAISDVLAELEDVATSFEISYGEALILLGLAMVRSCGGEVIKEPEAIKFIQDYLKVVKAIA